MNSTQLLAIRGVSFIICLLIFILSALYVSHLLNKERDREAYFWMGVCLLSGLVCSTLSKYFA
jgi:hypothetical protein